MNIAYMTLWAAMAALFVFGVFTYLEHRRYVKRFGNQTLYVPRHCAGNNE